MGSRNLFQTGLDAAWELDLFGGVRRNVESADAAVQAAIENIRDVHVSIAAEVAVDYVQLRGYQQEIIIAHNSLKVQQQTLEVTRKLYEVGFDSGLEMASAESALATTESQVPVLETGARQSIYALSVLLARQARDLLDRLSPAGDLPPIPEHIPAGLPSDLVRRRPDIRQAEAQLQRHRTDRGGKGTAFPPVFSHRRCKTVCHLVGLDSNGKIVVRKRCSRTQILAYTANVRVPVIGMEACSGAHFLGRALRAQGHEVRLMPAQYVKPYIKTNKSDYINAEAIAAAVQRPTMRFVPIKTEEQLDLQAVHRVR